MNTQQRAVVQQALKTLEKWDGVQTYYRDRVDCSEAITALRQLLEQAPEHDHALEQALTRLQKRYSELEAKVVAQPADLNLNCKSVQARLATQWGYVKAEQADHIRDATKMVSAGNKMAAIINTAITAPVDEWPTTDELDAAIKDWKEAVATTEDSSEVGHGDELTIAYMSGLYDGKKKAKREAEKEASPGGVLFAVEEAIRNGDCPFAIEIAFEAYEAERKALAGITQQKDAP